MKLVRYQDASGAVHYGSRHDDGRVTRIDGDVFGAYSDTGETAEVGKLLAPVDPRSILCIGLNYRKHAEESNSPIPEHPILFMKNSGALQNPEDPIILPRRLLSEEVDYEGELAVVLVFPEFYGECSN